ncbi:MAG: universal stress protein [Saprospiraceae bacterium]|nr:universal stress protein [Saprospiraceae bacterium]
MKNILFPTDFSEAAQNAFVYALQVAKQVGATITTIHAYQTPNLGKANLPNVLQEVYESIELEEFENFKDSVPVLKKIAEEQDCTDVHLNHVMKVGEAIPTIVNFAKSNNFDFIVMGTEGASGLNEIFSGSVAGEVLEKAPCPVLVVPVNAKFDGKMDKIAMTTEFKEDEKRALEIVHAFAAIFGASINCVNVDVANVESYANRMDAWRTEFAHLPNLSFTVIKSLNMESAIREFLEEQKIDVLAMLTHKRNFLQELFNFSFTKKMAYHLDTPILAIQAHNLD